jgi:hypothetical protein
MLGVSAWCLQTGTLYKAARPEEELLRVAASGDAGIPLAGAAPPCDTTGGIISFRPGKNPREVLALFSKLGRPPISSARARRSPGSPPEPAMSILETVVGTPAAALLVLAALTAIAQFHRLRPARQPLRTPVAGPASLLQALREELAFHRISRYTLVAHNRKFKQPRRILVLPLTSLGLMLLGGALLLVGPHSAALRRACRLSSECQDKPEPAATRG